ncbi:MAG: toprim domain-containing protein [archaeon]
MSENTIEQIRSALSTEKTIRSQASDWHDDSGGDRVGRCTHPEHGHTSSNSDGTPNLIVTEDDGWFCYSHETGGGIFEWIAVEEGIVSCRDLPLTTDEFKEVLPIAADRAGVELDQSTDSGKEKTREAKARHALETAVEIMHERIDDKIVGGRTIRAKLRDERGFSDETIDEAQIGYIDDQTQVKLLGVLSKDALKDIGLMRENEKWHCHDRVIYPYFTDGSPSYWIARATADSEIDAKYLKPKVGVTVFDQPMYEADSVTRGRANQLWIVEGIQDSLSLAQAGVDAISPVATNPSDMQFSQLAEKVAEYDDVVICFDADDSGRKKSVDLALELMRHGVSPRIGSVPERDDVDAVVEDPNEHFVHGGELGDFEVRSAADAVVEDRGDSEHVITELLSTVDPDSLRADRLVDEIASATPYRKSVLRKMCKQKYHEEGQAGWIPPERVEKTDNINPLWTFYWPSGETITLTTEEMTSGPDKFVERYVNLFNYVPGWDQDDWRNLVNGWLDEVVVVDPSPLTPEGIARELLCERIEMTPTYSTLKDAVTQSGGAIKHDEETGEVVVPKTTIKNWIEDVECSLRQFREFVSPFISQNTERVRIRGKRVRVWYFDADEIRAEGYSIETPKGMETPEEEEHRLRDMGDEVSDPDDDVDRGDGPVTDGGVVVEDGQAGGGGGLTFDRVWAMPNSSTFDIKPIQSLVESTVSGSDGLWVDPFSGGADYADVTNDLNPEVDSDYTMDAVDFLRRYGDGEVDGGVLLDPPYSPRQIKECYDSVGLETTQETTQSTFWSEVKHEIARVCSEGATVLTCGWNSGGIGKTNGFVKDHILLVPHGGWHNDTIVTVETYNGGGSNE